MYFVTWIIFLIWFSFADNAPITETVSPEQGIDITKNVTKFLIEALDKWKLHYYEPKYDPWPTNTINSKYAHIHTHTFDNETETTVHNITMEFNLSPFPKFQTFFMPTNCPTEMDLLFEVGSVSLKAYLRDSDQYVVSEINPFNVNIKISSYQPGNWSASIQNLDQIKLKPLNSGYQYRPNEETRAKQTITTYIKKSANEMVNRPMLKAYLYTFLQSVIVTRNFEQYYQNKIAALKQYILRNPTSQNQQQVFYYSMDNISSTSEGTLSNITIAGSWDLNSISMDSSNLTKFFKIQFTSVQGTLVQKFCSCLPTKKPLELHFKANHINAIADMKAGKMHIEFEEYSVTADAKSNITLNEDQSKSIVKKIESAIALSILERPVTSPPRKNQTSLLKTLEKFIDLSIQLTDLLSSLF